MKTLIVINGPVGIGKTWLAQRILHLIDGNRRLVAVRDFIWMEVQPLYRWRESYDKFKETVFEDGRNGREILIDHADSKGENYWNQLYIHSPLTRQTDIVIHDSIRKFEAQEFFRKEIEDFITIVIAPSHLSVGCLYIGDNGYCLPPIGGFRVQDSLTALERFKEFWAKRLNNADSQSIDEATRTNANMGDTVDR